MNDLNSLLMPEDITNQFDANEMKQDMGIAIATCIPILFFLPLVTNKKTPYLQFVSGQSLSLLVLSLLVSIVSAIIGFIPLIGGLVQWVLSLAIFLLFVASVVTTATGKAMKLPIIGHINIMDFFAK